MDQDAAEKLLFLTGRLAEARLKSTVRDAGLQPESYAVSNLGIKVAALMTEAIVRNRLKGPLEADRVIVPGRAPTLLAGNEGFPYAEMAIGSFDRVLWQPLSLMGQPRGKYRDLASILRESGMKKDMRIGLAGWKGFETDDGVFDPQWFETPHYLVEALNGFGTVTNAALLFMHPTDGLRVINEVEQLARFEYAATLASNAVRRLILGAKPGMSEYAACRNMAFDGFPQSVHVNMSSGPRAKYGLPSPSMRVIEKGDPIVIGVGLMGALNCRAGFVVAEASELPKNIRDYVDKLVAPYFAAAAAWYETIGIGVEGGVLYEAVMSRLGDPFFGIFLNPGHLLHLDEWIASPVSAGSTVPLRSGAAMQVDIIPATGTEWGTSNIEDGLAFVKISHGSRHPTTQRGIEGCLTAARGRPLFVEGRTEDGDTPFVLEAHLLLAGTATAAVCAASDLGISLPDGFPDGIVVQFDFGFDFQLSHLDNSSSSSGLT